MELVDFLWRLLRQMPGRLLVVWDGLRARRSRLVGDFVATQGACLTLKYLPAYTPELNPVEYLWGHWKTHELPNLCPDDLWELRWHARRVPTHATPSTIGRALWKQADLTMVTKLRKDE